MKSYLVLDIGGTNVKYGILTEEGEILVKDKFPAKDSKEYIVDSIRELAEKHKEENNIDGIAISAPGMIDADKGHFITAGALRDLNGTCLKNELETLTNLRVEMENDVNCVALAEKWLGNGVGVENFICIAIGTGIGGAIVLNDRLYRGSGHMAGEFGFMLSKDIKGKNTRMSTLSLTASTKGGIVDAYAEKSGKELDGEEISRLYESGDKGAVEVMEEFLLNISTGIYNLIFALDPQKVLLGGAISANGMIMRKVREKVEELIEGHMDAKGVKLPSIEACKFSNDSGLIGALYNYKIRS